MAGYIVTFFKNLVDSEGHPFKTTQDQFELVSSNPQCAVESAIERFANARHIGDWTLHADSIELRAKA
jgi:hypothetical protein